MAAGAFDVGAFLSMGDAENERRQGKATMESDFKQHPTRLAPDDFWGQVKRTVNGKPVAQEQIDLIVSAIRNALALDSEQSLLDLACGNGALSSYFFEECGQFLGVDFSEPLIEIARRYFERPGRHFRLADIVAYVTTEPAPEAFTRALCYGSFAYLPESGARTLLRTLHDRFTKVDRIFIGNLPDLDRHGAFYTDSLDHSAELQDPESRIGIWRSAETFCALGRDCGWEVEIRHMPANFYAAHYRYDALLWRLA